MEKFLKMPTKVPFGSLYLDPNNPRIAPDAPPGYEDPDRLFDADVQARLDALVAEKYDVKELEETIIGQGWIPIDRMIVWTYPSDPSRHVVLEGNRRTVALRRLRARLEVERVRLEKSETGRARFAKTSIDEQRLLVEKLERIVGDTESLEVVPINADTIEELEVRLPRVLAVRHISSAKEWKSYATDLWLLDRYTQLFESQFPGQLPRWEQSLINQIANEASLGGTSAKRRLLAASSYSHFRAQYESQLLIGEEFSETDYFLFESIVKAPFLREQFGVGEDSLHLAPESEEVLFRWTWDKPRLNGDDNENILYRHMNVNDWDKIHRYDLKNGTGFARLLDVTAENPLDVPRFREIEADYLSHKARRQPTDVIEALLQQLEHLEAGTLLVEGAFLKKQLERLEETAGKLRRMVDSASAVEA